LNTEQLMAANKIIDEAETHGEGNRIKYNQLKKRVVALGLKPDEQNRILRKVAEKLGV